MDKRVQSGHRRLSASTQYLQTRPVLWLTAPRRRPIRIPSLNSSPQHHRLTELDAGQSERNRNHHTQKSHQSHKVLEALGRSRHPGRCGRGWVLRLQCVDGFGRRGWHGADAVGPGHARHSRERRQRNRNSHVRHSRVRLLRTAGDRLGNSRFRRRRGIRRRHAGRAGR